MPVLEFPGEEHPKPFALKTTPGLHRLVWNLRLKGPPPIPGAYYDMGGPVAPMVLPGQYSLTLTVDGRHYTQPLAVVTDPRVHVTPAALQQQYGLMLKLNRALADDHAAANAIIGVRAQLEGIAQRLAEQPADRSLVHQAQALDAKLQPLLETFYQYRAHAEEAMLNYPSELNSQIAYLELGVDSADSAPTAQQQGMYTMLRGQLDRTLAQWQRWQSVA